MTEIDVALGNEPFKSINARFTRRLICPSRSIGGFT